MQTIRLYTLGKSTLEYDVAVPCLIFRHIGFMDSTEFRTFLNKALELAVERKEEGEMFGWVTNLTESDAFLEEDMVWAANDFEKQAHEKGLRAVAFVLNQDAYALSSISGEIFVESSEERGSEEVKHMNFKDEESAKAWLKEVLNN
ncbi:hypothetical protein GCM10009122_60190 [Fulvivirga kasyanovii]|uniref:STAS/SEC14 domain-containing protein n=1 Tax=Fulvivirga kasyanovii TaxID=396812 RepID=A0ABW9RP61_9BACT|nr:STAS/SEC14 domain-containing protein [Fulvivirga kasyanovii]MTI25527.1 hypothetical protein [Fulvivirga kasyanovii]